MRLFAILVCAILPASLSAQTPATPADRLAWTQSGPSLSEVQAYTYRLYVDGTAHVLTVVTCTGTGTDYQCIGDFPPMTPGPHSLQLSAANATGEGLKSIPLAVIFSVLPATPINVRVVPR